MHRSRSVLLAFVACSFLAGACKKEEAEPQSIPVPAAPSATPVAADPAPAATPALSASAAPTATAAAADTATAAPAGTTPGSTAAAPKAGGASIQPCCKALQAVATTSGKSKDAKAKAGTAAKICFGIDQLVKSGKTARSAAMTQIKAALAGTTPPAECN